MTCITNLAFDKLVDVHINNLNNIQKIISRLSNIGYTLLSLAITISSIMFSLIFSLNTSIQIRLILTITLLVIIFSLFISHLVNLKNEKLWILLYTNKSKLNLEELKSENKIQEILFIDFTQFKINKSISIISCLRSLLTIVWSSLFLLDIVSIIVIFFI
ncbi:MAG: hypothetical protein ACRDAW_01330 [Metamycoplasmataceae bacterium]